MRERPTDFRLNTQSPLARGLVFAGLGQHIGGTLFHDASVSQSHGTLTNFAGAGDTPADRWQNSQLRRWGVSFDGTNDYIGGILPGTMPLVFTIAAWVFVPASPTGSTQWGQLATWCESPGNDTNDRGLGFDATSNVFTGYVYDGSVKVANSPTVARSAWHHAATVKNATQLIAYANGVAGTPVGAGNPYTGYSTPQVAVGIAKRSFVETYYWNGSLADVMIWTRALATDEVKFLSDPANVDLRIGSTPLIQSIRRFWPVGPVSGEAPAGNRRRRVMIAA